MEARFGMPIIEELVELVEEVLPPPPGGPEAEGGIDDNEEEDGDGEENDEEKKSCRWGRTRNKLRPDAQMYRIVLAETNQNLILFLKKINFF